MAERGQGSEPELVTILSSEDPSEVLMARDILLEAGIEAFVFDAESSRMLGSTTAVQARLVVRVEDDARAREVLADFGYSNEEE
jgi:hypothetical protein